VSRVHWLYSWAVLMFALSGCESESASAPVDHSFDKQATRNIQTALHLDFHESMYQSAHVSGNDCIAVLSRATYDDAGPSGQSTIQSRFKSACAASYRFVSGHRRAIPPGGLAAVVKDASGSELFSDTVSASDADSVPARPQRSKPAVAYKIVDHYVWDCSSNGGFGEKAIVSSHKQSDLDAVVKEWMAANATDKSLCLHFEAYVTTRSFDAAQNPSHYTDDELASIPYGVTYTNNPNTGYEAWTDAQGNDHVLHKAN